ncbi:MAG: adenylyltransferase [Thermoprotei archaeon]|nr:MAG: adenylyltransferase [Thermoprotei archaeon]
MKVEFTPAELERYDRQLRLPRLGIEGQAKLKEARVLVAGVGGLGCSAALCLAMAGVGELVLVDKDKVELSNLNRQVLYGEEDVGSLKAEAAARRLRELNSLLKVKGLALEINELNVEELIKGVDLVIDGQDNYKVRFLLNKACVKLRKPLIHAALYGLEGRLMTIVPGKGPCLRCLVPTEPRAVERVPVVGAAAMVLGALQAAEAIKLIVGFGQLSVGSLLVVDLESLEFLRVQVRRNPNCPVCSGV